MKKLAQPWRQLPVLSSFLVRRYHRAGNSLCALLVLACSTAGLAADRPPDSPVTADATPRPADTGAQATGFTQIAPGHYLHIGVHEDYSPANHGDIGNTGFIVGTRSVVVIDPGSSVVTARRLRAAIRQVTELPVSHVILSHYHPDHVFGSVVFADVPTRVAHSNYPRAQLQRGDFYRERFSYLLGNQERQALANRLVPTGKPLLIDPGGKPLQISAWPVAHTDNDLTVFDQSTGTLWAADLVFRERLPSLDGSLRGWLAVLPELGRLRPRLVIPGHGSPGPWHAVVADQRRYLKALLSQTRAALKQGHSLSEAVATVGQDEAGRWLLFELQHPTNVSRAYTELEWE